eukprot:m.34918 g.34918  ORF g.34918 m.34918 type:complete len:735 (-) comp12353_c0_seq1:26-2230(-)
MSLLRFTRLRKRLPSWHRLFHNESGTTTPWWGRLSTAMRMAGPPDASKQPQPMIRHGVTWCDDYHWLAKQGHHLVSQHLERENRHTQAALSDTVTLQLKLKQELSFRQQDPGAIPPVCIGDYVYSVITKPDGSQVYRRGLRTPSATTSVPDTTVDVLDTASLQNALPGVFTLGELKYCPQTDLVGFVVHFPEQDTSELHVLNFGSESQTGWNMFQHDYRPVLVVPNVVNFEFDNQGQHVLYTTADDLKRPFMLFRQALTSSSSESPPAQELLLTEVDHRNFVDLSRTKDDEYITVNVNNKLASQVSVLPASNVRAQLQHVQAPGPCSYFVEHAHGSFYAITNHAAPNYKVVKFESPAATWQDWWPHSPTIKIEDAEIFDRALVLYTRQPDGSQGLVQIDLKTQAATTYTLPDPHHLAVIETTPNPDFFADYLAFTSSSPLHACTNWQLDLRTNKLQLVSDHVPQDMLGFVPSQYSQTRAWANSHDGVQVPVTLVQSKHLGNTPAPMLVLVYGAYGHNLEPCYNAAYVSLLQRGFRLAYCHVRGGGELSNEWHEQGRLLNKSNTFADLEACIQHMLDSTLTTVDQLIVKGTSAGGMAVGNLVVSHPDWVKAAILKVPFVDVLTTMLDASLPLTLHEADEWGNPDQDQEAFDMLSSYCPYSNVQKAAYPSMLVTACMHDNQVKYWQPAKFVAKVREHNLSDNPILLNVDEHGGHSTYSLDDTCLELAFMLKALGRS